MCYRFIVFYICINIIISKTSIIIFKIFSTSNAAFPQSAAAVYVICVWWTLSALCLMFPGGFTSTGCSGVLQLPALRLSDCVYHNTLSYCKRQGVLWILLEGKSVHTHTHTHTPLFLLSEGSDLKGHNSSCLLWSSLLCCLLLFPFCVACCCLPLQLMRKVLGTHLGHSAIYTMCRIMEERYCPSMMQLKHISDPFVHRSVYMIAEKAFLS